MLADGKTTVAGVGVGFVLKQLAKRFRTQLLKRTEPIVKSLITNQIETDLGRTQRTAQ